MEEECSVAHFMKPFINTWPPLLPDLNSYSDILQEYLHVQHKVLIVNPLRADDKKRITKERNLSLVPENILYIVLTNTKFEPDILLKKREDILNMSTAKYELPIFSKY
jgi:hypothetical protein